MPRNEKQGEQSKAAMLARVGSEFHGSDQTGIYVPTDAEYDYYNGLIHGYFLPTLARWFEIAKAYEEEIIPDAEKRHPDNEDYVSNFLVAGTPDGLAIRPDPRRGGPHPSDLVLKAFLTRLYNAESSRFSSDIWIHPGPAGKQLLVDTEHTLIEGVEITVVSGAIWYEPSPIQRLSITTSLPSVISYRSRGRSVEYKFKDNELHITREGWGGNYDKWSEVFYPGAFASPMSDDHATHLFKTINDIIEEATTSTPQTEQPATIPEPQPLVLPYPGRRLAG